MKKKDTLINFGPRYVSDQDDDPCEIPTSISSTEILPVETGQASSSFSMNQRNNLTLDDQQEQKDFQIVIVYLGRGNL